MTSVNENASIVDVRFRLGLKQLTTSYNEFRKSIAAMFFETLSFRSRRPIQIGTSKVVQKLKILLTMVLLCWSLPGLHAASVNVDLTQFTSGAAGGRFIGSSVNSNTGASLAHVGDHNGDGFQDYVFSSAVLARVVIVMKRNTTYAEMRITDIISDQYFRVITGPVGSFLGSSVGGIGDINDDGFDDVIVGARSGDVLDRGAAGFAFVAFGHMGPFIDLAVTAAWTASSTGFVILGPTSSPNTLFVSVNPTARGLGDVNDDGVDDFAVSARWYPGTSGKSNAGVVWLIFGKKSPAFETIDLMLVPNDNFGSNGIYYTGALANDNFGISVRPAGDFNGDGIADFLIGATGFDPPSRTAAGAVYLVHGSKTSLVTMDMSTFVNGAMGVRFLGAAAVDTVGYDLGGVGDINGDGIDDIALGAPNADPLSRGGAGIVYVIYGTTTEFSADVDLLNFAASSVGFPIYGRAADMLLCTAAPAGDINRDGVNDILVGGSAANSRVHIVYGQTAARVTPVDTSVDDVVTIYFTDGATLGLSLDGGHDFTGDGLPDLLLSGFKATVMPEGNNTAVSGAGAVWMIDGLYLFPVPTAAPTIVPSAIPSHTPSAIPSVQSTLQPTDAPTNNDPTIVPTLTPSMIPSIPPSALPSMQPTKGPTRAPTLSPSLLPTALPSHQPSLNPSAVPTSGPTLAPTNSPTVTPTTQPTAEPTLVPTMSPTVVPTLTPTAIPTLVPTAQPSMPPTLAPSPLPTVRPTATPVEIVLGVEQEVYNVTKADYDAQQAACNNTIQHTVADSTDGVTPERVTDIVVEEEEEEEGGKVAHLRALANSNPSPRVLLKYKVTVYDPLLTVEIFTAQLKARVVSKEFDDSFRHYALLFNATRMIDGTFGEPRVTQLNQESSEDASATSNVGLIVGVAVGGFFFIVLVTVGLCLLFRRKQSTSTAAVAAGN